MIVVFDLDYTLLDTKRFKNDLANQVFGLSTEEFCDSYNNNFKAKKENYNLESHLQYLLRDNKIKPENIDGIRREFNRFIAGIDGYLFPEAEEVIQKFKNQNNKLMLLSFGDKGWQEMKINHLKIHHFFDRIEYEEKNKKESDFLQELKDMSEEVLVINDNLKESHEMMEILREEGVECKNIVIDGPYSKDCNPETKIDNIALLLEKESTTKEYKLKVK